MPVFFYIDPTILDDPSLVGIKSVVLSYTFFRADDSDAPLPASVEAYKTGSRIPDEAVTGEDGSSQAKVEFWRKEVAARIAKGKGESGGLN